MSTTCQPGSDDVFGPVVQGCRSNFDFTLLFEQTILSIGPAALLLLFAPPRLVTLLRSSKKTRAGKLRLSKSILAFLLIGAQLGLLICWSSNRITRAAVPSAVLGFLATMAILLLSRLEHTRSVKPSFVLNVYLLGSVVFDAVQARTLFLKQGEPVILGLLTASIAIKFALLVVESRSKRPWLKAPYNSYSPEATSGIFNRSFFWWINPLLTRGFRKLITVEDLFTTDISLNSKVLLSEIEASWGKCRASGKYALVYASFHCLRWKLAAIVVPRLCLIGFNYSQPFLIASAIKHVSQPDGAQEKNDGYGLIAAAGLIYLGIAITTTHYKHHVNRTITAFRGAMVSLIYAKTLQQPAGLYDDSAALTLMSTDIDRLTTSLDSLNEVWARIIEMSIGIWLLERQLGWVCIAPIVIVALSVYASTHVTKRIGSRQAQWVKAIQKRVGITSSMLGSMKSVKMMGLSGNLFDTLHTHRVRELDLSKSFRVMGIWRMLLSFCPPIIGPLASFVIFAIQAKKEGGTPLDAGRTFSSLAIISLLTEPASSFLQSLPMVGMSTGCLNRIQRFLLSDSYVGKEQSPTRSIQHPGSEGELIELPEYKQGLGDDLAVSLKNASILPAPGSATILDDTNLGIKKESLTMVVGVVGSGKSTLLKAIIGELNCDSGSLKTESVHMAYCAQAPWLPNDTVRRIVCGYGDDVDNDTEWYNTVLAACALDQDVKNFPNQDDTIIGSRGVTLSGGQKQRLALARAAYSRHSTVVLDDVLSAIDTRTEKIVVDNLLGKQGIFRKLKCTVILATHAVRHLPLADSIVVLGEDGRIAEQGSFDSLRSRQGFVSKLLLHPELLESKRVEEPLDSATKVKSKPAPALPKVLRGPSDNDVADLTRRIGDLAVYKYYLKSIGWKIALLEVASCSVFMLAQVFPPLWLTLYSNGTVTSLAIFAVVYAITALLALGSMTATLWTLYMRLTPRSGVNLHKVLLTSVMKAPQAFFDETDCGVTLNRFSQDMTLIDGPLPNAAVLAFSSFLQCIATIGLIAAGSTWMALTLPVLVLLLYLLQNFYLRTSRQMRFLDLECKSPLYTHFAETLEGLSTIRAFGWQHQFNRTSQDLLDKSQRPYYLLLCIQRWFNLFLLLLVGITAVAVVALTTSLVGSTSPGRLGVSLSSIVGFTTSLSWFMLFWIQAETSLGAIARVKGFQESTASEDKEGENVIPSKEWPSGGAIEFKDVTASYGDNSPALSNMSFHIKAGQKIGICGRTGSGKSTLLSLLLRILDPSSGKITIYSLDLSTLPRSLIRSKITTIPQEPFILSGTVRQNADPLSQCRDTDIIAALKRVHLWAILGTRGGLDAEMTTNPLSTGQQQIFCLARAVLKSGERGILVLDEATSSLDEGSDEGMRRVVEEAFGGWTVVTVAHRVGGLLGSDGILVLDGGRVVESGSPNELLGRKGVFWELVGGR